MCKKIQEVRELNNLEKIQDSVQLCLALMQLKVLKKVQPSKNMYSDVNSKEAEKPKQIEVCVQQTVGATGLYMFIAKQNTMKMNFYLILIVIGLVFFLLFRVWPEWLRLYMYYISWYTLVFLIGTAIVRFIVWFIIFHLGIDFWIFPEYFCDSNNPLDAFWPLL